MANSVGVMAYGSRPEIVLDAAITSRWIRGIHNPRAFIYIPPMNSYNFVGECSNRGDCYGDIGDCSCYNGFESDDCSQMNVGDTK